MVDVHHDAAEVLQELQKQVLVLVHDQEHHEQPRTVGSVVHHRALEVGIEFLQALAVGQCVVLLIDQFEHDVQDLHPLHSKVPIHQSHF